MTDLWDLGTAEGRQKAREAGYHVPPEKEAERTVEDVGGPAWSHKDLQRKITKLVDDLGGRWWHDNDSRGNEEGFPDLLIGICPLSGNYMGRVIYAEIKTNRDKPTPKQREWLDWFLKCNAEVYLWKSIHFISGEIEMILRSAQRPEGCSSAWKGE